MGCASDDEPENAGPAGDGPELFEAQRERWVLVCRRATASPETDPACEETVEAATAAALEASCRVTAVDAYLEVAVSRWFESLPDDTFFASCPAPLAPLAVAEPPPGFTEVEPPAVGLGLLSSGEVAATFVDSAAVESYLVEVGHQLSYARRWESADEASVTVRLDRFAEIAGASHFTEVDDREVERVVIGVDDGRITTEEFADDDGREAVRQIAAGRVCNVAVTVVVRATGGPWDETQLEELFVRQVHRVRALTTC